MKRRAWARLIAGALVATGVTAPAAVKAQQAAGAFSRPPTPADTGSEVVERPVEVPRLHHTHLNTIDPEAAIDWYVDVWPQGRRGDLGGYPAFVADVPVLFTRVEEAPEGAWDPDRNRAFPQSAFWHIGAFGNTTARFEALEARGHTVLRLARDANDPDGVVRSGLAGEEERPGGFGYLVGPDGALVEITGGPSTSPRFAHVHLFGERPRCSANWYADMLGFEVPAARDPDTGNPVPRDRYEPCDAERAAPTWPSLDPAGTIRGPSASIRHGSGTISIYPRQCLGDQCEVDEPLVPSRGQVLDHVAFEVQDLEAWIAWLEQEGVTFLQGRSRFGEFEAYAERAVIEGPDGLSIELVQLRTPRVIERLISERWVLDGQQPDFVPFEDTRVDYHLTSVPRRGRPGGIDSYVLDTRFGDARLTMRDPRNTFISVRAPMPDVEYRESSFRSWEEERARDLTRWRLEALTLPAGPFIDVPVSLPEGGVTADAEWADTLEHHDRPGLWLEERWDAVRRYRVVGDTVMDGQRYPVVSTETDVIYAALLSPRLGLGGYTDPWPRVRREAEGRSSGRMILDPKLGLRIEGTDTTRLEGTVTLIEPDGVELSTPAVYDRVQRWALTDSLEWAAELQARREAAANRRTGMLILARDSVEERLRAGDEALADSLLAAYAEASGVEERGEILGTLTRFSRNDDWRDRVEPIHLAAGDSAYAIARLMGTSTSSGFLRPGEVLDSARAEGIVARLERPEALLGLGIHARRVRENVVESFLRWTIGGGDGGPCRTGSCRYLAERALASPDRDVQALGVVTRFLVDPSAGWEDLQALREQNPLPAEAVWDVAAGLPDPEGRARVDAVVEAPEAWTRWRDLGVRERTSAAVHQALDLRRRRVGWDPTPALRSARATAESDSARVVLGWALELFGVSAEASPQELASVLADPSSTEVAFADATRLAWTLLREADEDPEMSDRVTRGVLEMVLSESSGAPLFRSLDRVEWASDPIASAAQGFHGVRNRGFILRPSGAPPAFDTARLREIAAGRAIVQDSAAAATWDEREGGVVVSVSPFQRVGDLGVFSWRWTVYARRTPEQAPLGYSGGGSFLMVRVEGEWRVASASVWVT